MGKPETTKLPQVDSVVFQFTQDEDTATTRSGEEIQMLRVEVCSSEGIATSGYFAITTERWAINSQEEFAAILRHVAKAAGMVQP